MRSTAALFITLALVLASACGTDTTQPGGTPPSGTGTGNAVVQPVERVDVVSDTAGGGAATTDPELINAWGLAFNPAGPAWVSATERGLSTVYDVNGQHVIPSVHMPLCGADAGSPTGQVWSDVPSAFLGDKFIFVTEQGTIAGWQPANGTEAKLRVNSASCGTPGGVAPTIDEVQPLEASYKGVTIAKDLNGQPRLYVANFRAGTIDVFDSAYNPIRLNGQFTDPNLPAGYAPFNVQEVDGALIVTYAKQDEAKEDDVRGAGNGFVDLFSFEGLLASRLISGGELNAPWGVTKTPANFGQIPNRLLIGNFGDGLVHVYTIDATVGLSRVQHEGTLGDVNAKGNPLVIDGLWALRFGLDAGGFRSDVLYFTAGPGDEKHGVFGRLTAQNLTTAPIATPY